MGENKGIGWMYEGAKSLVNREDYLLGKKIGKDFEKYSDVVNDQKPETLDALLHTRTVIKPQPSTVKTSALESYVVATEDPLVAVKVKEETRRRELLENPLMKLKFQRMLKELMAEREGKVHKKKKRKKDKKKKRDSSYEEESSVRQKKRKKRKSRDQSYDHHSIRSSSRTKSRSQRESCNTSTGYEKSSRDSDAMKHERDFEAAVKPRRRSRSPVISKKKKRGRRSSSQSSSDSNEDNKKSRRKETIRRRRESSSPEVRYRERQSSSCKSGVSKTKISKKHQSGNSSSSDESSSTERPSSRITHKQDRRRSRKNDKTDRSTSSSCSERQHSSKKRRRLSPESRSSGNHDNKPTKESMLQSSRAGESNYSVQRSPTSTSNPSRQSGLLTKKTEHSSSCSASASPSTSLHKSLDRSSEIKALSSERIYQDSDADLGNCTNKKKLGGDDNSAGDSNPYDNVKGSQALRLFDSHIPEHLRPKGLAIGGSDDEVEDEFDKMEKKRKERLSGYGLVGSKKEDEDSTAIENPYKLARKPTLPVYKKTQSHGPLTEEEKQKKLREMEENAAWRQEVRKSNIKIASLNDVEEAAEEMSGKAPSFLRNQLNAAASDLTVEQRLQSKKKSLQRSHGFMEQKFTSK